MKRRSSVRVALALLLGVVLLAGGAGPAFAGHGTAPQGWPDNKDQHVDRHSLTASSEVSVARGIAQLNRSDLNVTLDGSGDIDVYDANYGDTGWDGITECTNKVASTWLWQKHCDIFSIKYNNYVNGSYSLSQLQAIGCHEFGHTGGLDHRTPSNDGDAVSCMRGSGFASASLDTHDLDVINAKY